MAIHSIYLTQASRHEQLTAFSYAIEKGKGRELAFQTLNKQDRIAFLALNKINGDKIDWNNIEKRQLRGCVQTLLQGSTGLQPQKPIKELSMATILTHLRRCIKGKHNCKSIGVLLGKVEKFHGTEIRSKLHACIHTVCKKEKTLQSKMKIPHFGRKAFTDPQINPKLKLVALDQFETMMSIPKENQSKKRPVHRKESKQLSKNQNDGQVVLRKEDKNRKSSFRSYKISKDDKELMNSLVRDLLASKSKQMPADSSMIAINYPMETRSFPIVNRSRAEHQITEQSHSVSSTRNKTNTRAKIASLDSKRLNNEQVNAQKSRDYAKFVTPVKNFIVTQVTNWFGDFNAFLSSMR